MVKLRRVSGASPPLHSIRFNQFFPSSSSSNPAQMSTFYQRP